MTAKSRKPGTKCLEDILESDDTSFISFIEVSRKIFSLFIVMLAMGSEEEDDAWSRN